MKLAIDVTLEYTLSGPTDVLLQIEAAMIPEQTVEHARIDLPPTEHFARVAGHNAIGDRIWVRADGTLSVRYEALVAINRITANIADLPAVPPHLLPAETIEYILPSRYCPADEFQALVSADFENLQGGARIAAMRDWIENHIAYVPGSSNAATTALETYVSRTGVCRDYAHLMIAMARASTIPARFASVYGLGVEPQDFHAVAEVFLDNTWHLIDPTGMSRADRMAKIGVGRDAADVSFLTSFGNATLQSQAVAVSPG